MNRRTSGDDYYNYDEEVNMMTNSSMTLANLTSRRPTQTSYIEMPTHRSPSQGGYVVKKKWSTTFLPEFNVNGETYDVAPPSTTSGRRTQSKMMFQSQTAYYPDEDMEPEMYYPPTPQMYPPAKRSPTYTVINAKPTTTTTTSCSPRRYTEPQMPTYSYTPRGGKQVYAPTTPKNQLYELIIKKKSIAKPNHRVEIEKPVVREKAVISNKPVVVGGVLVYK